MEGSKYPDESNAAIGLQKGRKRACARDHEGMDKAFLLAAAALGLALAAVAAARLAPRNRFGLVMALSGLGTTAAAVSMLRSIC
jgi:hypothetical protein